MTDYRKYLEPQTVAALDNIELKARLVVEGFITGLHKSPFHGYSVEFAEHRQYRSGDEIRHIDWKVFARTNRYYVKQFEEETNLRCTIALDTSGSMAYASKGNISKYEYSKYLSASLAYLMTNQRDAVGLALYSDNLHSYMPARSKQSFIFELIKNIDNTVPDGSTGTAASLDILAERIKRRGLVIIISDFFDDIEKVTSALKHFRHKSHEVIVFQILDPREIDFKFDGSTTFVDLESKEEMNTQPFQIQKAYMQAMKEFTSKIESDCHLHQIDYHLITTDTPFDKALRDYMSKRRMIAV